MYPIPLAALALAATAATAAPADAPHPIDIGLDHCLSQESAYSTAGMLDCIGGATQRWDRELNDAYRQLMAQATPEQQESLRAAQRAWLQYRDREYQALDTLYGGLQGTMYLPMRAMRVLDITRVRAQELRLYLQLLQ